MSHPTPPPWQAYSSTFLGDVVSLAFDPYADLIWTGSSLGTVVSHFLPNAFATQLTLTRYSSFKSHPIPALTRQLILSERAVLSLGDRSLKSTNRRGLPLWFSQ